MIENDNLLVPKDVDNPEEFKPKDEEIELPRFMESLFEEIEAEDPEEELRRYKKWQKNRAFYRGNQRGFWDEKKRTWVTIDLDRLTPSEASVLVINNQFRPQVKTLAKEFSRSQTRIRAGAISDSQRSILTGRFSDALIRHYQPKLMPESARQVEAKYLLLTGNSFRYTRYNHDKKSVTIQKPVFGAKTLPEYVTSVCTECGYKSETDEGECSKCQSPMETTRVPAKETRGYDGHTTVNTGDPETEIVDPTEIKMWAGGKNFDASPYIRRRRFVKEPYIKNLFPFYTPSDSSKLSDSAQGQWQFSDTATTKDSSNAVKGTYEFFQYWIEPSYYVRKKLKKAVTFKKKQGDKWIDYTLKVGTILTDVFPEGMYICKVGKDILGYYPDSKKERWLHIPFDINIDGAWADGLEDSVMNQQIINEYTSLSVENVLYNASPKLVINPALINPVAVTGRPKDMILMSDNARRESEPKNAFAQISGMSLTNEVMQGIEAAKRDMREQTGALLGFNGQGDPNIATATGMSIARDSALALVSTPLAIRAEIDEKWCWQIIKLVKENWYDRKYQFLLGKYNQEEAEAFKESILEEEINLFVEANSWMPQTNFEKLQNLGAYLTAFGLPLGFLNEQIPEPIRQYGTQLYNMPFDFDEMFPDIRIAQRRLDTAKTVAETEIPKAMQGAADIARAGDTTLPDGTVITANEAGTALLTKTANIISDAMGLEEDIDDHAIFIKEYVKYLKTDEGQNAHPILRQAIKSTIHDHKAFLEVQAGEAAKTQMVLNGGQPPEPQTGPSPWQQNQPAESPFQVKNGPVDDFSENADKSNL
jgi:hypothetical protein